jgi:hypothetical protein
MTSVTAGSMDTGIDTMGIVAISRITTVIVAIGIITIGIVATGAINIGIIEVCTVTSGTVATGLVATSMFFQSPIERSLISHAWVDYWFLVGTNHEVMLLEVLLRSADSRMPRGGLFLSLSLSWFPGPYGMVKDEMDILDLV